MIEEAVSRKKGETYKQYSIFIHYLHLTPPRTINRLYDVLEANEIKITPRTLYKYREDLDWEERALKYDEFLEQKRIQEKITADRELMNLRNKWIISEFHNLEKQQKEFNSKIHTDFERARNFENPQENMTDFKKLSSVLNEESSQYCAISNQIMNLFDNLNEKAGIQINNNINTQENSVEELKEVLRKWDNLDGVFDDNSNSE